MTSKKIKETVEAVLRQQLGTIGYVSSEVIETEDHDGDPILEITIHYRKVGASVDPKPTFSLTRHLRAALRKIGENRFPHFKHHFPEDQEFKAA